MTAPAASIISVNLDGKRHLEHLLPSLMDQDFSRGDFEILLVDNGSSAGSISFASRICPTLRILSLSENCGFARANNLGVQAAQGEYVALINNDTRADPRWLESLVRTIREDEAICISGRILDWEGDRIDFIRGIRTFDGHAFQLHQGCPAGSLAEEKEAADLPFPCGGNMIIRREDFLKIGGFDEDYFAYLEDVDLGWRILSRGGRIRYTPDALIYHHGSATSLTLGLFRRAFLFEKNAYMTVFKNLDEDYFSRLHAPILLAFMHRMDRVMTQETSLHRDMSLHPYEEEKCPRIVRFSSPHVRNHMRAYHWIMAHLPRLRRKREAAQSRHTVSDAEITERFPLHLIPTYPGDDLLFSLPTFTRMFPDDIPLRRARIQDIMEIA